MGSKRSEMEGWRCTLTSKLGCTSEINVRSVCLESRECRTQKESNWGWESSERCRKDRITKINGITLKRDGREIKNRVGGNITLNHRKSCKQSIICWIRWMKRNKDNNYLETKSNKRKRHYVDRKKTMIKK